MSVPNAGGGGNQIVNQQPWDASQPFLNSVMQQAQHEYKRAVGGNFLDPNTGQWTQINPENPLPNTVTPQAWQTQAGVNALTDLGSTWRNPDQTTQAAQQGLLGLLGPQASGGIYEQIAQGQGVNPYGDRIAAAGGTPSSPSATGLLDYAAKGNLWTQSARDIADTARMQTTQGVGQLQDIAGGGANPYLDSAFDQAARQVQDRVKAQFFGQGSGSGYQQDLLQRGLGDLASNIYGGAYESDAGRRLSAANSLAGIQQGDLARRQAGLTDVSSFYSNDQDRRLAAANAQIGASQADRAANMSGLSQAGALNNQGLLTRLAAAGQGAGQQLSALDRLPTLQQAQRQPAQDLLQAGAITEGQSQRQIDDALMRYQEPMRLLQQYSGLISGLGGLGGTSIGKTSQNAGLLQFLQAAGGFL